MSERERFVSDNSAETPERGSPQEVIKEFSEVKELIDWLIHTDKSTNPVLWSQKRYRLNQLFMKRELSPDDLEGGVRKFQELAEHANLLLKPTRQRRNK
ncbi:MAG: hypothetical protein NTV39_00030 [Candidatus Saccharibacteria bacterium]|nr:hypothetical protein [Candidatus Saccharibacteria bacterium]